MKKVNSKSAVNSKEISQASHKFLGTTFIFPNMLKLGMNDNLGSFNEFN